MENATNNSNAPAPLRWEGVMPAITTPLTEDDAVDHAFLERHVRWLRSFGVSAIIPLGSLGEGATLRGDEKRAVIATTVRACDGETPVVPAISALSTAEAIEQATCARAAGCSGLMVLPPYVYQGSWREMEAHFTAVISATELPCMLYNNPIAYGTDVKPAQIAALARRHANLVAVKESSGDVRRITAIRALVGERLRLCVGLDDAVVEGVRAGADGWVAGVVNALPKESVALFEGAREGARELTDARYRRILPLLRMDTVPEFVQLIKLMQVAVKMGTARVRAPRLELSGEARARAEAAIRAAIQEAREP